MSEHLSVLLPETIALLEPKSGGIYVDLTLGRAGTSSEILKAIGSKGMLYAFDMDEEAIDESRALLESISPNFKLIRSNFAFFKEELAKLGVKKVDGITIDLGVSSPQFDKAERGFSYKEDAPLDMRMDQRNPFTAKKIVNTYSLNELTRLFREYGEEKEAYQIAKAIVTKREEREITTTGELVAIIKSAKSYRSLEKKGHPAKQVFQALRIETNNELANLEAVLEDFPSLLKSGGKMVAISFHSLEDRLLKKRFRELTSINKDAVSPFALPSEIPEADFIDLTHKPIIASEEELAINHRAKSAKLRAIMKK